MRVAGSSGSVSLDPSVVRTAVLTAVPLCLLVEIRARKEQISLLEIKHSHFRVPTRIASACVLWLILKAVKLCLLCLICSVKYHL